VFRGRRRSAGSLSTKEHRGYVDFNGDGGGTEKTGASFASAYLFGAVCPSQGKAAALIMPICNTAAMNHHLSEISSQVAADAHAAVILDRAGWHRSQGLLVPGNITLLELPPYSLELNPVERVWGQMPCLTPVLGANDDRLGAPFLPYGVGRVGWGELPDTHDGVNCRSE